MPRFATLAVSERRAPRYSSAPVIGETIGNFEVVARAGRGGMGEVFVAEHRAIKTRVAVKVLHAEVSTHTGHVERFFNEARAVARIQHAGIVKIFDVGFHTDRRAYLIMEYLEGESLARRLRRAQRLSPHTVAEIARQIASVLDATHHAGIIHRDLKPDNIFLVPDRGVASGERIKILDFGIAKLSNTLTGPTTVGGLGTPKYMAPEQWNDAAKVDARADVYSLGCIAYEMAAGRPPFVASSIAEACARHLNESPQPVRDHAADVPPALDALILRMLAKDPAERPASMHVVDTQLGELTDAIPVTGDALRPDDPDAAAEAPSTTLTAAASVASPSPVRRHAATVAAAAVIGLATGGVVLWRLPDTEERPGVAARPPPRTPSPPDAATSPAGAVTGDPGHALATWLEAANPFIEWHGARWLAHQVTRREYRRFLESMTVGDALRHEPVTGWDDRDPMRPVAWLTFERAAAFCRAIGAALPSSDAWLTASEGAWGLDPTGAGQPGPLQEWTATTHDGLVVVRGGHDRMSIAERAAAARDPLMKSSEAQAGPSPAANIVASETIGFRCVRPEPP